MIALWKCSNAFKHPTIAGRSATVINTMNSRIGVRNPSMLVDHVHAVGIAKVVAKIPPNALRNPYANCLCSSMMFYLAGEVIESTYCGLLGRQKKQSARYDIRDSHRVLCSSISLCRVRCNHRANDGLFLTEFLNPL